jgi:uncharacterized membrane protein YhiD involved in acid resistance
MAEPVTQAFVVAVTTPAVALLFTAWPFGLAFIAGCVALIYLAAMKPLDAVKSVIGSTLIGGAFSQLLAGFLLSLLPSFNQGLGAWASAHDSKLITIALLAIIFGLLVQHLMPRLFNRLGREVDGQS